MAEVVIHKERLQAGTQPGTKVGEEEGCRRQAEQDLPQVKKMEDTSHRLEGQIGLLENEESQMFEKEQALRQKRGEVERDSDDVQRILLKQDGALYSTDVVKYIISQNSDLLELHSRTPITASGDQRLPRNTAEHTMEISVGKDRKTGGMKILSVSAVDPGELYQRGVKVYDDGCRVVYEVRSGGTTTLENGVHPWSSSEVDELLRCVGQAYGRGDGAGVTVTLVDLDSAAAATTGLPDYGDEVPEPPGAKPVTVIFVGEEQPRDLAFDSAAAQADIVLIDEDDEKSLREKTVTDVSTMDGNAADLVAGRPLSVSSELSSEEKENSSVVELPPPLPQKKRRCRCCTVM
ncbi:paralemmin-2 [Megalops cyprinoides]|uniref:paralemmin-2 n=1 Tax=Megalops cyprinoides TaxID=118141 RepID=UPI0018651FA5|nr:paralemmin-2 [Megalops cyprinoides]